MNALQYVPITGANVITFDSITLPDGTTKVDRALFTLNDHSVQVNMYDRSPQVVVVIDADAEQMHISKINQFIQDHTR